MCKHSKHQQEKLGLHFDLASLSPPSVPDEENFALTPVVADTYKLDAKGFIRGPNQNGTNWIKLGVEISEKSHNHPIETHTKVLAHDLY